MKTGKHFCGKLNNQMEKENQEDKLGYFQSANYSFISDKFNISNLSLAI